MAKATKGKKAPAKKIVKAAPAKKTTVDVIQKSKGLVVTPKNKTGSFTYSEFLENVRAACGLKKRTQAKEICEDIARVIKESLKKQYIIPLMGLGKLKVRRSEARVGRNPQTGEPVQIPARKRVRFSPAKALKEEVLK